MKTLLPVYVLCGVGFFTPFHHLVKYAQDDAGNDGGELSEAQAAGMMVALGIANSVGRVLSGKLADKYGVLNVFPCFMCTAGALVAAMTLFKGVTALYAFAIGFGLTAGAFISLFAPLILTMLGPVALTDGISMCQTAFGAGGLIGSPIAGLLYDHFGNYSVASVLAGICFILTGLLNYYVATSKSCIESPGHLALLEASKPVKEETASAELEETAKP